MVAGSGLAVSGVFVASMIAALIEFGAFPPRFGSIMAAGQVASWRLKWVMIPVAIIVLWGGARIIRSIKATPGKFIGLRAARMGFAASVLVTVMIGTLIGVTIPERLRQRDLSIEAKWTARAYTFHRAQLEYRELHGTLPTEVKDLRTLPDSDGSIADALNFIDPNGYQAGSVLAAASTKSKPLVSRGSAIRNAAPGANATADHAGVSFTSYDLRLPGEDKILNTDDDFIVHDGVVTKVSDLPAGARPPNAP
jgi:type II secretory pathway pseudopilin PulG